MKKSNLKIILSLTALTLLVVLTIQLIKVPMFMFPSVYLTTILIIGLLVGSLIIAGIIKAIFKRISFIKILSYIVSIVSIFCMYKFYSPTLTIIVPKGYTGKITLVLSNVDKNILNVDSNGIGYITKQTFDKVYTQPIVIDIDGVNVNNKTIGFNSSTFWSKGSFSNAISEDSTTTNDEINYLSFEVAPKDKHDQKQYYSVDLSKLVDRSKLYKKE